MVDVLDVEVWGSGIIVTLPGTNYWVTYFKEKDSPGLFPADIANKDDPRVTMTAAEFLEKAWKLANEKARELGWVDALAPDLEAPGALSHPHSAGGLPNHIHLNK